MTYSTYFVKSTPVRGFIGSFQHFADMLHILKMCIKEFEAENIFFDKITGFLTWQFSSDCTPM